MKELASDITLNLLLFLVFLWRIHNSMKIKGQKGAKNHKVDFFLTIIYPFCGFTFTVRLLLNGYSRSQLYRVRLKTDTNTSIWRKELSNQLHLVSIQCNCELILLDNLVFGPKSLHLAFAVATMYIIVT